MDAAVYDEKIFDVVHTTVFVDDGRSVIFAHTAGAGLMLTAGQAGARQIEPCGSGASFAKPALGLFGDIFCGDDILRMPLSGKTGDRNSPRILGRGFRLARAHRRQEFPG